MKIILDLDRLNASVCFFRLLLLTFGLHKLHGFRYEKKKKKKQIIMNRIVEKPGVPQFRLADLSQANNETIFACLICQYRSNLIVYNFCFFFASSFSFLFRFRDCWRWWSIKNNNSNNNKITYNMRTKWRMRNSNWSFLRSADTSNW